MSDRFEHIRLLEAILFASNEPLSEAQLGRHLPEGADLRDLLGELAGLYGNRGVHLVQIGNSWAFRSAPDLAPLMKLEKKVVRKLSRVAMETLAIIAYHQPVTRAEIEEIRGVALSRGTLDILLEAGWIKPKGRRRTPGRPVTWGTNESFLDHFGLSSLDALPGVDELKAAGLLDSRPAIAALGARSRLPDPGEIGQEMDPPNEGEEQDLLSAEEEEELVSEERRNLAPENAGGETSSEGDETEEAGDDDFRPEDLDEDDEDLEYEEDFEDEEELSGAPLDPERKAEKALSDPVLH